VNELLTYDKMLVLLVLVNVQFMKMVTDLQLVLIQELMYFCSKTITVLAELTVPKTMDANLLHFYCIRNKYIEWKCIYIYTVQVHTSTSGIFIHCIQWGCQSPTLRKYILHGNFVFDLHYLFQEHNPGVKQDLPVNYFYNVCRPDDGLQQ
jgi:hypothetical protein